MEEKQVILVNRIKVSELGITFLRQLPAELNRMKTAQDLQKQKENFSSKDIKRRGSGVDFFNFTNQTQNLIKRQKCCLFRVRGGNRSINESHHKLQLHYDNWVNQQNITKNRVSDIQSRMMQNKYSEYDWLGNRQALSLKRKEILGEWEIAQDKRRRNLQRILGHRGITEHSPN